MASCDWMKIKTAGEAKAIIRHSAEDERAKTNHSNKDIDPSKSYLNMTLGALKSYSGACKEYDERIAELDSLPGANKRKDRVTMVGLEIPAPAGMPEDKVREWFLDAYEIACDELGIKNIIGGSAHFDECHAYRDAETKEMRMSRAHLHICAIPEKDGKLNAKAVTGRAQMIRMNNRIEAMTAERYPDYQFMDGSKRKSRKSVEQLKAESEKLQVVADAQAEAAKIIEEARQRVDKMDAEAAERLLKADEDREQARREKMKVVEVCSKAREKIEADEKRLQADRERLQADMQDFTQERESWRKKANKELTETISKAKRDVNNAKMAYKNAYEDALHIVDGIALDCFYDSFQENLQREMQKIRFKDGVTGWDKWSKYLISALDNAKRITTNTPKNQYKDRVTDRVERADNIMARPLSSYEDDSNADDYGFGF